VIGPCVRSGYCCRRVPCPFGHPREGSGWCVYLGGDRPGFHWCMIHAWIKTQPGARVSPAFGAGCCSSLNGERRDVIRRLRRS